MKTSIKKMELTLARCLHEAVRGCAKNPLLIFSGCPETTQLAARVVMKLGYEPVVVRGKARTAEGPMVHHIWVEIPELDLRVETNPSQIFGVPAFAMVLATEDFEDRYFPEVEDPGFLERVTKAGERFYSKLADKVVRCVRAGRG